MQYTILVGRPADAHAAYTRAMGLSEDPAARAFLAARAENVRRGTA